MSDDNLAGQLKQLGSAAESGGLALKVTPDVFANLIKQCNSYLDDLNTMIYSSKQLEKVAGWGDLASAKELGGKFEGKALEFQRVAQGHVDIVNQMIDTFTKAHKAYTDSDQGTAQAIGSKSQ